MHKVNKKLVVIVGPTAVGKTDLAFQIARLYNAQIISADSRQFYRETEIGTAKPETYMLEAVKHHFVNSLSIEEEYTAGQFERDALQVLDTIFSGGDLAVMVGGSGLYVRAVCEGFDEMPEVDAEVRVRWNERVRQEGLEVVQQYVEKNDPEYYSIVDKKNPARLIRAAEVIETTGKPFSQFRAGNAAVHRPFATIKIGLTDDREMLYQRIDDRMDKMIDAGLFAEAEQLSAKRHLQALQTVGYQEIFGYLEGKYDRDEAIRLLKRNSRRYAKRQLTWFRKDPAVKWFGRGETVEIMKYLESKLRDAEAS